MYIFLFPYKINGKGFYFVMFGHIFTFFSKHIWSTHSCTPIQALLVLHQPETIELWNPDAPIETFWDIRWAWKDWWWLYSWWWERFSDCVYRFLLSALRCYFWSVRSWLDTRWSTVQRYSSGSGRFSYAGTSFY